jgi:hypothetical protein
MPWDADRSGSVSSPIEECARAFPSISWRKLERSFEADGINRVRMLFPNMMINSDKCEWIMECLESWEYKLLSSVDDWAAKPKHDRYSHVGDALRYIAEGINQFEFIRSLTGRPQSMPSHYPGWRPDQDAEEETDWSDLPPGMRPSKFSPLRKKKPDDLYEATETGWKAKDPRP